MKKSRKLKTSAIILIIVICIFSILMIKNRAMTIMSFQEIDNNLYTVDYSADYELEKMLEKGISSDNELSIFLSEQICFNYPINVKSPDIGGSVFSVKTYQNDQISGKNLDSNDPTAIIVKTNPKKGFKSMAMVQASSIGMSGELLENASFKEKTQLLALPYMAVDGINEKGVYAAILGISSDDTQQANGKVPITATIAIRAILDKCSTVEDAKMLLRSYDVMFLGNNDYNPTYHFFISDKTGDYTVAEYCENNLRFEDSNKATNFQLNSEMLGEINDGEKRYNFLDKKLYGVQNTLSIDGAFYLLSESKSNDKFPTQLTAVYNLREGYVDIAMKGNYENIHSISMET